MDFIQQTTPELLHVKEAENFQRILSSGYRLRILNLIKNAPEGSIYVSLLCKIFDKLSITNDNNLVSKHVGILRRAGLINYYHQRGSEKHWYYISATGDTKKFIDNYIDFWFPRCIELQSDLHKLQKLLQEKSPLNLKESHIYGK